MKLLTLALTAVLGQGAQLPPGHPPIDGQAAPALPAGMGDDTALPAGHPAIPERSAAGAPAGATLPPGHPAVQPGRAPPSAEELMQQLDAQKDLKAKDKPFNVAAALAKLYYSNGRYADAAGFFRQAMNKAAALRALYLKEARLADSAHKPLPAPESVGCGAGSEAAVDELTKKAQAKADAHDSAGAAACARAALRPVLDAESLLADALFLSGDASGGLAEHEKVLAIDKDAAESLYGHAGMLLDSQSDKLSALKTARAELARYLSLRSDSPRATSAHKMLERLDEAIAAGGMSELLKKRQRERPKVMPPPESASPGAPPMAAMAGAPMAQGQDAPPALTPQMMESVRNTEMTPEMVQGLQKLVEQGEDNLAHGQYQAALDAYKRVVPFQPDNGRAKAGMAWALVGLGRPMADRIWMVAVQSDASAVDKLGDTLAGKGDGAGAQALWRKLSATAPDYAAQAGLSRKVK